VRRTWPRVRELVRTHKMAVGAAGGTLLVLIIISFAVCHGSKPAKPGKTVATGDKSKPAKDKPTGELAERAQELLTAGKAKQAADLIETELAGSSRPEDGDAYLVLGHARFAMGRRLDAISAYERAIKLKPKLAGDADMRANATKALDTRSEVAPALLALELLASAVEPPAHDAIVAAASSGKNAEVRHRAFAIAEREGIADKIDKLESWTLDLSQAASCDDRRAAVVKLGTTGDKRALPALRRVKVHKCVQKEVADAIAKIESGGSPQ